MDMERKLDEVVERIVRLETAEHYRHQALAAQLYSISARLDMSAPGHWPSPGPPSPGYGAWIKVPLALCLPILVFLLMLAITGDPRAALNAARLAG